MAPPTLSIIIPAYNAERTLHTAIDSVIMQRCDDVETVVVDDGSTDGTWEIIESYGDRVIAIRQENAGACVARNNGVAHSSGPFLKFLDADDFLFPESLRKQIDHATGLPERSLSFGGDVYWYENTDQMKYVRRKGRSATGDVRIEHIIPNIPTIASITYSRASFDELGGFDTALALLDDFDIFVRAVISGHRLYSVEHPMFVYRQHDGPGRISQRRGASDYRSIQDMYRRLLAALDAGTPAYPKDMIKRGLARHLWTRGRSAARDGDAAFAKELFAFARELDRDCVVGSISYRIANRILGPASAESTASGMKDFLTRRRSTL